MRPFFGIAWDMNIPAIAFLLLLTSAMPATAAFIRVNQLGYPAQDVKTAIVFGDEPIAGKFEIAKADDGAVIWRGKTKPIRQGTWGKIAHHAECDFSNFKNSGRYILRVGAARSVPFTIGNDIYAALPDELLEFMREQRCGYNPFLDQTCHQLDGRTAYGPAPNGTFLNCSGGWHDAGDLLKYLLT